MARHRTHPWLRRSIAAALAALGTVAVTALTGGTATSAPAAAQWQPCQENPRTQCTSVTVPVDWAHPAGPVITVAVARRIAPHSVGTLVYLPAGPGSSGVDAVTSDEQFPLLFPTQLTDRFDVVSFDPRGVRRSSPVRCPADGVATLDQPTPVDQQQFDRLLAAQHALGPRCRALTGPVFDHLDSTKSARDVDAIRAALGAQQVNLYGLSYGTVIGEMYAERFPARLRTLVLDGVYDHSASSDRFDLAGALGAQESFDQFVSWCAATPSCALHGTDVRHTVAALFAKADRGDLPDPADASRHLDSAELTSRIVAPLTQPNLTAVADLITQLGAAPVPKPHQRSPQAEPVPLPIYTQCADTRSDTTSFTHYRLLAAEQRRVAPDMRRTAFGVATLCINPPTPPGNPQHDLSAAGAPPVLVVNSRYDPATPYQGAQRVARQLRPQAVLLTYAGLGHGAANRTACTRNAMDRYLTSRQLPAPGTVCPAG